MFRFHILEMKCSWRDVTWEWKEHERTMKGNERKWKENERNMKANESKGLGFDTLWRRSKQLTVSLQNPTGKIYMWWITGVPIWHECFFVVFNTTLKMFWELRPQGVSSSFTQKNFPKQSLSHIGVPLGLTLLLVNLFDFLIQRRPNEIWHNSVKLVDFNGSEYVINP